MLAAADAEVQRRLNEIARYLEPEPESPGTGPDQAFGALSTWHVALDAYRSARHAEHRGAHVGG